MHLRPSALIILAITGLCWAALPGCVGRGTDPGSDADPPTLPFEVTANPRLLTDPSTAIDQLSVRGVRLGDPRSAISARRVLEENDLGWVFTRDGCRYRVIDGKVAILGCWDRETLEQLGIGSEDDVERVFGKPEEKLQLSHNIISFRYQGGQKRAIWNRFEQRLVAVNLGRPADAVDTDEASPDAPGKPKG